MSDSDSELLKTNNDLFTFQNESIIVSARGPNINSSNLSGLFRQNMTSTMNMPRNYEWLRRPESLYDQKSMGYRRETSPMSIASACDARQRNYNNSYYARAIRSQRSVYNGRGGSPTMSFRSIDSNATVSVTDIVMALKNAQSFSKHDQRNLQEACKKFMKHKARRGVVKRRNLRQFLKGYRRNSGNDSGELGSDSSISSDDNRSMRSTKTLNYKNLSRCRSTKTDISDFRRNINDSNRFRNCTNSFTHNRMIDMASRPANLNSSRSSVASFRSMIDNPTIPKSMPPPVIFNKTCSQSSMNQTTMTQIDRFKNGFLLPSQRFNRSVAATSIPKNSEKTYPSDVNTKNNTRNRDITPANNPQETDSDDEQIFSQVTAVAKPLGNQRKRSVDRVDDVVLPNKKRPKTASPCKYTKTSIKNSTIDKVVKDFEFAKPAFPVCKSANMKIMKEKIISTLTDMNSTVKLISKSALPPIENNEELAEVHEKDENEKEDNTELYTLSQNTTDVSLRPSFIKRKLFSQKMDVADKTDDIAANSPQNSVYHAIQKEKTKARKLVTSQFCLSRDIQTDDNNLLDLIHKIVPAERMNATNQTNKTVVQNKSEDIHNWDVTSIISTRHVNEDDLSDTFTDEDSVAGSGKVQYPMTVKKVHNSKSPNKNKQKTSSKKNKISPPKNKEKSPLKNIKKTSPDKVSKTALAEKNGTPTNAVQKYIKSFWDTDFESDAELKPASWTKNKPEPKENKKTDAVQTEAHKAKFQGVSSMFSANKTISNNTIMTDTTVDRFESPHNNIKKTSPDKVSKNALAEKNGTPTNAVRKYIKSFWDTDFESDAELKPASWTKNKPEPKENKKTDAVQTEAHKAKFQGFSSMFSANKTIANNTIMTNTTVDRFNNTKSLKLCSHRNSKPKRNTSETVKDNVTTHIEAISSNKTTKTKLTTCLDDSEPGTSAAPVHKQLKTNPVKPKPISKILPLKKGKANKENEPTKSIIEKVTRIRNSKPDKTITDENAKPPTRKVHNRTESKNQPDTAQKKQESKKLSSQSKNEPTKQTKNKESAASKKSHKLDTVKPQENENKNSKSKKPVTNHVNTTLCNSKNNNTSKKTKITTSKLSDSTIHQDSFTETNNNSIRPVRSCRISKQNETLNSRKANQTLNVTLRSMVEKSKNHVKNKATANIINNKKAEALCNINARLLKVNDIDNSDISFTISNDKGSPIRNKEILANFISKIPDLGSSKQRPVRSKLANKRYVS